MSDETKETIYLGDEAHEITVRPITLVYKNPEIIHDIRTPNRIMIDSMMTLEHTRSVKNLQPRTAELFKMVFPQYNKEITPENIRRDGTGMQHVIGLVDLALVFISEKKPIGFRYPEAYLHPAAQAALADVIIDLATKSYLELEL